MAIDFLRSTAIQAMPETVANRNIKRTADDAQSVNAANTTTASKYSVDEVALTETARMYSAAKAQADASDGVDYEKVALYRQQIEDGTYEINPERIADKMISFERALFG